VDGAREAVERRAARAAGGDRVRDPGGPVHERGVGSDDRQRDGIAGERLDRETGLEGRYAAAGNDKPGSALEARHTDLLGLTLVLSGPRRIRSRSRPRGRSRPQRGTASNG
jgi:hypothetical protein